MPEARLPVDIDMSLVIWHASSTSASPPRKRAVQPRLSPSEPHAPNLSLNPQTNHLETGSMIPHVHQLAASDGLRAHVFF